MKSGPELIKTLIPVETARRIADGSHDDPFAVLGPHRRLTARPGWWPTIRAPGR
jgi:hypothetical protein